MAGAGNDQVGVALHWERRLGAGENGRASTMNGYEWGGSRKEGEKSNPENGRRKSWLLLYSSLLGLFRAVQ